MAPSDLASLPIQRVETVADLRRMSKRCSAARALAVDTEFERSRSYFPRPGLLQFCDGNTCYLVDPLAIDDLSTLFELLLEPGIVKILHACSEDLEVFVRLFGATPYPVFDTQLAAAFTGNGYSLSYGRLISTLFGIDIPKDETRSDWLARPLTPSQVDYAAMDVAYLVPAHDRLRSTLSAMGRLEWMQEDCQRLLESASRTLPLADAYLRLKQHGGQLDRRELGVLRALCAWREQRARQLDRPRGHVARDELLVAISKHKPQSEDALLQVAGGRTNEVSRNVTAIVDLVGEALNLHDTELPDVSAMRLDSREFSPIMKRLQREVRHVSQSLDLPAQLLAPKRVLVSLIRHVCIEGNHELPIDFTGWRDAVIGRALLSQLIDEPL